MKTEHYFRRLDQQFERHAGTLPRYWNEKGLMCPYCDALVLEAHPKEAQDVCPTAERFYADDH